MSKTAEVSQILKADSNLSVEQVQSFFKKTPAEKVKIRPAKGGGVWKYVSGSYVTQVLNSLFGFNWTFEVVTSMSEALATANTGTIVVQGRLKVKIGDEWITKEQFGRKEVTYKTEYDEQLKKKVPTTDLLDFGNDMKAAATDAKKKCASELGLFADVYSQEDFLEVKIIDQDDAEGRIKSAKTTDEIDAVIKSLPAARQKELTDIAFERVAELNNANSK